MDLGYDKPLEALEWISYTNYNDAAAAVLKGEVDFALQGTGQNLSASTTEGIEIVCYQSDMLPTYSTFFWTIPPKHSSSSKNVPGTCNRCPGIVAPIKLTRNGWTCF